jgi:hypothetical protein
MVKMHARARVMKTLFERVHSVRSVGRNSGRRGSNAGPNPDARAATRSSAAPESLERSELIALFRGLEKERITVTRSVSKSQAPPSQRAVRVAMLRAMVSHDSSVSGWDRESRTFST